MFKKTTTRFIAILTLLVLPFWSPVIFADEPDIDSILENWHEITDVSDFVAKFSKFVYIVKGEEGELTEIIYEYLGQETLDGVSVEKVSMRGSSPQEEHEMLFWIDGEGKMKKVIDQQTGDEVPLMFAGMITMFFFLPFYMVENFDEIITEVPEEAEIVVLKDVSERNIGGLPATVYTYNITGHDEDGQEVISIYELGDFGDFQIMVGFDVDMPGEEHTFGYWVEEIVLH